MKQIGGFSQNLDVATFVAGVGDHVSRVAAHDRVDEDEFDDRAKDEGNEEMHVKQIARQMEASKGEKALARRRMRELLMEDFDEHRRDVLDIDHAEDSDG